MFKNNQIATFNDFISVSVPFEADFECAVPAAPLMSALSKYTSEEVEMTVENGELRLKCGRRKNGIKIHEEINLPVDSIEKPSEFKPVHPDFPMALGMVVNSCGKDDSRYTLTCVHITDSIVEACDSFQITKYKIACGLEDEFILPAQSARLLSGLSISEAGMNNGWLHCKDGETTYACRTYSTEYPKLDEVIDNTGKEITFPVGLSDMLKGASVFTDTMQRAIQVNVADGLLTVRAENDTGWFEEANAEIDFDGEATFMINPDFFSTLLKHGSTCKVSDKMLVVENENHSHVACLVI